jgi:hypothetical protein
MHTGRQRTGLKKEASLSHDPGDYELGKIGAKARRSFVGNYYQAAACKGCCGGLIAKRVSNRRNLALSSAGLMLEMAAFSTIATFSWVVASILFIALFISSNPPDCSACRQVSSDPKLAIFLLLVCGLLYRRTLRSVPPVSRCEGHSPTWTGDRRADLKPSATVKSCPTFSTPLPAKFS